MLSPQALICQEIAALDQEQAIVEQSDWYREGKTDGAFGYKPQYANASYLEGYIAGVKEFPVDPITGRIDYRPKGLGIEYSSGYDKWVRMIDEF